MKVTTIAPHELDARSIDRWRALTEQSPALASPYFAPELTLAVASARDDVRIAVLEDGEGVVGYFPFQPGPLGSARPVGGIFSDHHGVVAVDETRWSWRELLRGASLSCFRFDHLVGAQARADEMSSFERCLSPALDLSRGFAAYCQARSKESRRFAELKRNERKLAREVGPVRFEPDAAAATGLLEQVLRWKSEQCRRTGVRDVFEDRWARALIDRIHQSREAGFSGVLSALYAGDELVAAHMGMRSPRAWHWWFPTYDHRFAKYSPGALLLVRVAESAAERGASLLDLGKGDDAYKESFADTALPIADGLVGHSPLGLAQGAALIAERRLRASTAFARMRPLVRSLRRLRYDYAVRASQALGTESSGGGTR